MNSHRKTLFIQGKIALLIALGLSLVVALDLYRDRVAAREVETVPSQIEQIDILKSEPRSTPSSDSMLTLSPEQEGNYPSAMAIEAQPKASGSEPAVSQADAGELAAAVWAGASFPVENFQTYTSPFGYRRAPDGGYRQEFHYGLDMAAPNGSYIRNWWSGTVVEVSDGSNCGTSVVVESGDWIHIYCHMRGHVESQNGQRYMIDRDAGIQIWEGQQVVAGSRIGRVGMTGRTTGPHLHWGLKYQDNWVDPALVLRAMYAGQQAASREVR